MLALPLYDDTASARLPVITYGLIGACGAVFYWQLGLGHHAAERAVLSYGMVPAVLFCHAELPHRLALVPPWATLVTSMFLHGGWLHILGNMLYLWLFGKGVEAALGPFRFLFFYLICGITAALTQAAMDPMAQEPMIGASGAIAGVLGAYLMLYPRAHVTLFVWILILVRLIAVPAVILLGLWFLMQLLSAVNAAPGQGGVAFWAHIGGFIAGMVLVFPFRRPGVGLFQPARSRAFAVSRPRQGFGRGSVPPAGRRRSPWD